MKNTLIFLILLLSIQAKAQIFKIKSEYKEHIDSKKNTWSIGLNGNSARVTSGFINPPLTYYFPTIGLKVGYNPSNRTTLGVEYSHQPVWGNVLIRSEQLFYTGIFARYDVWRRRHALSLELNYRVSNVSWYGFGFEKTFPVHYGGIGYNFRTKLYPNVYFTYSKIWQFNLTQPKASFIQDARKIGRAHV